MIKIERKWAMPNKHTFSIKPIKELLERYIDSSKVWIDPFANDNIFKDKIKFTNDINKEMPTTHHLDALDFLKTFETDSVDGILFDPPYSIHQVNEVYDGWGDGKAFKQMTRYCLEIVRIVKRGGHVISFGWNSGGIPETLSRDLLDGKKRKTKLITGFKKIEILLVPHGSGHNDTIITVDQRSL